MKTGTGPGDYKQAVAMGVCSSRVDVAQGGGLFLQVPSEKPSPNVKGIIGGGEITQKAITVFSPPLGADFSPADTKI